MAWVLSTTVAGLLGRDYRFILEPSGRALIIAFLDAQGNLSDQRRKYGGVSLQRNEYLSGGDFLVEFAYLQLWNPITFMSRDIQVNGSIWTMDNAEIVVRENLGADFQIWEFVL